MKIGKYNFDLGNKTYVMGILNVTPDSFSDGGRYNNIDVAIKHTKKMIDEGASIIDVGGESTRPGYQKITDEEEMERVVPIIEAINDRFDIPISIDTYKSKVAKEALKAGACLVNDIWGLKYDNKMSEIIKRYDASCCIMHNAENLMCKNVVDYIINELSESINIAKEAGISDEKIIIDPGIGFGKSYETNLSILKNIDQFHSLKYPLLIGCSKKSVIGNTLNLPVNERLEGTLATSVIAVMSGCSFLRVHNVKENIRAIKMAEAVKNGD